MTVENAGELYSDKIAALRKYHALNPHPERVKDESFVSGMPFFDARDLVQVKYEMLRRVKQENLSVTDAAAAFGFSRPSFYHARRAFEQDGLAGLLPQHPGPRRSHKLSDEVMEYVDGVLKEKGPLSSEALVSMIREEFGVSVHPRSVERALARRKKNG